MLSIEKEAWRKGFGIVAGVDEAGRGPLAGPVVAAAVTLPRDVSLDGLTDSKRLTVKKRETFFEMIAEAAESHAITVVDAAVIDDINILQASRLAMLRAVRQLGVAPDFVLVDGAQPIDWPGPQRAIVKGDSLSLSIAAASVLAKVTRDRIMTECAARYPEYGFDRHKGYGSAGHREAIARFGPCPIHRKTFRGVREFVEGWTPGNAGQLDLLE